MTTEHSPSELIESWLRRGVITPEQAGVMRADVARDAVEPAPATAPGEREGSVLVEALGWLGATIVVIGLGLLVGTWWNDLGSVGRIALVVVVAAALVAAGFALPDASGASRRVRAALWLAGSLGAAFAAGLLVDDAGLADDELIGAIAALVSAAVSGVLWWIGRHVVQHLATAIAVSAAPALLVSRFDPPPGDGLWPGLTIAAVGASWAALAAAGAIRPDDVGVRIGGAISTVGFLGTLGNDAGRVIAVLAVAGWVGVALWRSDLVLLGVAALGALISVPVLVTDWFPGALSAAFALLVVGGLLVGAAVFVARRRREATT